MFPETFTEPRAYREERDLQKMQSLLIRGRQAQNGSYYIHTGDLNWWLFYLSPIRDWQERIFLWEGDRANGELSGWALISPESRTFDVFVDPEERGGRRAAEMYVWAEERTRATLQKNGESEIRTMWVSGDDKILGTHLESRGFTRSSVHMVYLERSLHDPLEVVPLPPGWRIRPVADEHEAQNRAEASYASFGSRMPFEAYVQRYLRFMRSPAYACALDLVALAPDGCIAAFCICWFDLENQVGLFEPVGTHPDFQRRGLGKAVLRAGLEQMKAQGMKSAIVVAESNHPAAQALYFSAGFVQAIRLDTYTKKIRSE
jgi:ribosomal protein S18 acetylase RimI-like enzyme